MFRAATWDDYMLAAALFAVVTIVGAILEWRRMNREEGLGEERYQRARSEVDALTAEVANLQAARLVSDASEAHVIRLAAQVAELETARAVADALAAERVERVAAQIAAAVSELSSTAARVLALEIEARAQEIAAEREGGE